MPVFAWIRRAISEYLADHVSVRSPAETEMTSAINPTTADDVPAVTQTAAMLTPRQMEIVRHLASGRSDVEIAKRLGISISSTRTHIERIREKLASHRPPGLMELTQEKDAGAAMLHLAEGFDDLFRRLGPPPDSVTQSAFMEPSGGGSER
ncbi:response regulator transcription factor [Streptomyces sp. NPDC001177]